MTTLYVVATTMGGYAREDASVVNVVGGYTEKEVADKVAMVAHAKVVPIEINHIPQGYLDSMYAYAMDVESILKSIAPATLNT